MLKYPFFKLNSRESDCREVKVLGEERGDASGDVRGEVRGEFRGELRDGQRLQSAGSAGKSHSYGIGSSFEICFIYYTIRYV